MGTCWLEAPRATTWLTTFDRCPAERSNSLREFLQKLESKGIRFSTKAAHGAHLPAAPVPTRSTARSSTRSGLRGTASPRSRGLAVIARYRNRRDEDKSPAPLNDESFGTRERPRFPYLTAGLYLATIELARHHNIATILVLPEPRLANHLGRGRRGSRRHPGPARQRSACKANGGGRGTVAVGFFCMGPFADRPEHNEVVRYQRDASRWPGNCSVRSVRQKPGGAADKPCTGSTSSSSAKP